MPNGHLPPPEFQQLSVIPVYPFAELALHYYNYTDPTRWNVSRHVDLWRRGYARRIHFSSALVSPDKTQLRRIALHQ